MMRSFALRQMTMAFGRIPNTPGSISLITSRHLSSQGVAAVENLRDALEEYRKEHYRQCLPSRFKKDLVKAATNRESGRIAIDDLQQVIANISMEHKISEQEMETIFQELGESGKISADKFMKMI
ncbi:unnamed protein product [Cylindrotheca closterium]|uniref:Uncharacterized protein n=1 Tax=Cylindrotheca closterium TaxID=2856 RepID=A0AAD2FWH1_9STRA|nr:unnamed protein product [Cylindrotheca closterium]